MNTLIALVALAGIFSNTSCRSARDNQIDILERELRAQEDYIYELEDYIVDYSEKLRQYRCANMETMIVSEGAGSAPELAQPRNAITDDSAPTSRAIQRSTDDAVRKPTPRPVDSAPVDEQNEESPENLDIPTLEIGEPVGHFDPYETATPLIEAGVEGALLADGLFIPDPSAYQTAAVKEDEEFEEFTTEELMEEEAQPFEEDLTPTRSRAPERLVISHVFRNTDQAIEPTSLLSIVEARDARNEPADFNGKVSLMVMQVIDERPQRVKRWDFTAEETSAAWQSSNLGDGLHLELPLDETQLPEGPLELWVRLETADGRKLLSQVPFEQVLLASIAEAEDNVAAADEAIDDATHLADANPLRHGNSAIETKPIKPSVETQTAAAEAKAEPQWRAATHYSSGPNTGYSTTATDQRWNTRPIGSTAASNPADQPTTKGPQQWRARRK